MELLPLGFLLEFPRGRLGNNSFWQPFGSLLLFAIPGDSFLGIPPCFSPYGVYRYSTLLGNSIYDVDHDGYKCPPSCQKKIHLPNVKCDEAHMYEGACMRAQHKTLPDGTGAGRGWMTTKQMEECRFVLDKQAARKAQH